MKSENDIERFVEAQNAEDFGFADGLMEIEYGRKRTHWIWYVFPQLRGLGRSWNAEYYGLAGKEEAEAYLAHPILGQRLRRLQMHCCITATRLFAKFWEASMR